MPLRLSSRAIWPLLLAACYVVDGDVEVSPYQGEPPYPNRRPVLDLPRGELGFVTSSNSDTIEILDLRADASPSSGPLYRLPVGRNPVDIDGPHHLAVDRDQGVLYTILSYPEPASTTSGLHQEHGSSRRLGYLERLSLRDFSPTASVRLDEAPGDIVMSEDKKRIVVTHFDLVRAKEPDGERRSNLVVATAEGLAKDPPTDPIRRRVCRAAHGLALSRPAGDTAYVACYADDALAVVDLTQPRAAPRLIPLGVAVNESNTPLVGPYSVTLSPSGKWLAVGLLEGKAVMLFDAATLERVGTLDVGAASYFVAFTPDEKRMWIPTQTPDTIQIWDLDSRQRVASRAFTKTECERPHEVGLYRDNSALYTVCEGTHQDPSSVLSLDPTTLGTVKQWGVGAYPDRLFVTRAP
jgi:DNA-binding beta-propeller fold protein YncE